MGEPRPNTAPGLLTDLLKSVSRSFYLTLRILPSEIRRQIGLAYLLARASDTIADTDAVPVQARLHALEWLRQRVAGTANNPLDLARFCIATPNTDGTRIGAVASDAERHLLLRLEEALQLLPGFPPDDQAHIRKVLEIITAGQELDLRRFELGRQSAAPGDGPRALQTWAEFDDYTYRVAGCVGEFWTRICYAHLHDLDPANLAEQLSDGVAFGQGLQMVNILRDLPKDLSNGRCYIPVEMLRDSGLAPLDLTNPAAMPRFRTLYMRLLDVAESRLTQGWTYSTRLARSQRRVRLACAWPLLIGFRTIAHLRHANALDASLRVKISRKEIRAVILRSLPGLISRRSWEQLPMWAKSPATG